MADNVIKKANMTAMTRQKCITENVHVFNNVLMLRENTTNIKK